MVSLSALDITRLGVTNGYAVWATCEEQLYRESCTFFHPAPHFLAFSPPILAVPVHLAARISVPVGFLLYICLA